MTNYNTVYYCAKIFLLFYSFMLVVDSAHYYLSQYAIYEHVANRCLYGVYQRLFLPTGEKNKTFVKIEKYGTQMYR